MHKLKDVLRCASNNFTLIEFGNDTQYQVVEPTQFVKDKTSNTSTRIDTFVVQRILNALFQSYEKILCID